MIFTSISDVHIKSDSCDSSKLFFSFIKKSLELKVDRIYLLGDVFDLFVGNHKSYLKRYDLVFKKLIEINDQVEIYFLEGNHDFHLKEFFEDFNFTNKTSIKYYKTFDYPIEVINNKKVYLGHGDYLDKLDISYKYLKIFFYSNFFKVIVSSFLRFKDLEMIESFLSKKSNKSVFIESSKYKLRWRNIAQGLFKSKNCDLIILGHSHIADHYIDKFIYLNNGEVTKYKKFILFYNGNTSLEDLI